VVSGNLHHSNWDRRDRIEKLGVEQELAYQWPGNDSQNEKEKNRRRAAVVDHFLRGVHLFLLCMLNVVSYRRRERKRSVILSIFSHIDRTGQTHNYEFFFFVRPSVRSFVSSPYIISLCQR